MTPHTAGFAYLALGVLLVGMTAAAIAPRAFGWFSRIAGFAGMLASFFVPHTLVVGGVVLVVAWSLGAFSTTPGLIGLALHGVAWIALSLQLARVVCALPVLDGVPVRDADQPFSDGVDDSILKALAPGRVRWQPSLFLRTAAMRTVRVTRGIVFREIAGKKLRLDVYHPPEGAPPRPAVVYVHGGGWIVGTRRQSRYLLYELAAAGFPCISISYRFAPWVGLEAVIEDCKWGLAWAHTHVRDHGGDGRIVVMGGSAGGHLAALLALTPNHPHFQAGFESANTATDGAVVFYGVSDLTSPFENAREPGMALFLEHVVMRRRFRADPEPFRLAQPLTWASATAPPTLLVHGSADELVPIEHSRRLAAKLRAEGAKTVHLLEVPFAHHAFEVFPTPLHQRAVRVVTRFLEAVARRPLAPPPVPPQGR